MTILHKTLLSAAIALSALAGIPAAAQADNLYLSIQDSPSGHRIRDWDRRDWDRRDRDRHDYRRDCTPRRALDKADRMGIRRARIDYIGRRVINVDGFRRGHRVEVTFARVPGCPIIR